MRIRAARPRSNLGKEQRCKTLIERLAQPSAPSSPASAAATATQAQTPVTFQLNWMAGGANAGFAAALGEGYYKEAGLDVTIVQGNGSGNTAQLVASGRAQLAYADAVAVSQLDRQGRADEDRLDDLSVEPERGDRRSRRPASSR